MFQVNFWGVRGTIPCAETAYSTYGGNTSCISLQINDHLLIFDAGTGIYPLGKWIQNNNIKQASLFLSHMHFDHIIGLPFFKPLWDNQFNLDIYAGVFSKKESLANFFATYLNHPLFPGPLYEMANAKLSLKEFVPGTPLTIDNISIKTLAQNHPGGSTGYRIEALDKSFCYLTDIEHKSDQLDQAVLDLINQADCLVYDAMYTEDEFKNRVGWGHSTWQEAIKLCKAANVKKLYTYHHSPDHDDDIMHKIESEMQQACDFAHAARQGLVLNL